MIQQNDCCEFNGQSEQFGIIKELYLKLHEGQLVILCSVQWFKIESQADNVFQLLCSYILEVFVSLATLH
jgi:hypothetical protein